MKLKMINETLIQTDTTSLDEGFVSKYSCTWLYSVISLF